MKMVELGVAAHTCRIA